MVASSPLRIRVTSFLAGFGVCSAFALYQLRQDVLKSSSAVLAQAQKYTTSVEDRLTVLEAALAEVRNSQIQASVPVAAPAAQQEAPAAPQQEQQPAEAQAGTEP